MPLYYMHSKQFHPLFKLILEQSNEIQKILNISNEKFVDILGEYIYQKTDHYEFKQILKNLHYGDIVFQEAKFDYIKFIPFSLNLDENKNYNNIKYVQNALSEENKYFEEQIEMLKDILDKATDLCETKGFLQKNVLEELSNYFKNNKKDILLNFPKFYEENNI